MSEENALPRGWISARLRDIAPPGGTRNSKTNHEDMFFYVDIEAVDNIAQKIVAPKQIKTSNAPSRARMAIQAGDVIFSLVRPYLKNIAIVPQELDGQVASTAYCVMRPESGVLSSFVFYAFLRESFIDSIVTYGNSPPSAHDDEFLDMTIPLAPTNEQHRIVSAIEQQFTRLDAGVAALKRTQAKLKRYRAAVLKAAVEGNLTEVWRAEHPATEPASILLERILKERRAKWEADLRAKGKDPAKMKYVEPAKPDMENLSELPEGWCWATVEELSTKVVDGTHHTPTYIESGIPFISVKDIRDEQIFFDDCKYISNEEHERLILRCHPECDDVLITKSGTIGRVAVIRTEIPFSLFVSVALIKTCKDYLNQKYFKLALEYYILGINIQQDIKGGLIKNLHLEDLRIIALRFPPFAEQDQIVSEVEQRLSIITQLEATVEANLKRAERLRQSILKEAFTGRLVPQDPNDEPASVLLKRIRKEREGRKKGANGNGRFVRVSDEPVQIDVEGTRQVELWEGVGGG